MVSTLDRLLASMICVAALASRPALAEQPVTQPSKPKTAYTLELGATDTDTLRSRLWVNNLGFQIGNLKFNYDGFNEAEDGNSDSYFGWHKITVGEGKDLKGVFSFSTDKSGLSQVMIGIRDTQLVESLGGFGFLDFLGNDEGLKLTVYYGKNLDKDTIVELLHETFRPYGGNSEHYTELQVNHKKFFYRKELVDFNDAKDILGLRLTF